MDDNIFVDAFDNAKPEDVDVELIEADMEAELNDNLNEEFEAEHDCDDGQLVLVYDNQELNKRSSRIFYLAAAAVVMAAIVAFAISGIKQEDKDDKISVSGNAKESAIPEGTLKPIEFNKVFKEDTSSNFYEKTDISDDIKSIEGKCDVIWADEEYVYLSSADKSTYKLNTKTHDLNVIYDASDANGTSEGIFIYNSNVYRIDLGNYEGKRGVRVYRNDNMDETLFWMDANESSLKYYCRGDKLLIKLANYQNDYPSYARIAILNLNSMNGEDIMTVDVTDVDSKTKNNKRFAYSYTSESSGLIKEGLGEYNSSMHIASSDENGFFYQLLDGNADKCLYYYSYNNQKHVRVDALSEYLVDYMMYIDCNYAVFRDYSSKVYVADFSKSRIYEIKLDTTYRIADYYAAGRWDKNKIAIGNYNVGFMILDFESMTYYHEDTDKNESYSWNMTKYDKNDCFLQISLSSAINILRNKK